MADNDMIIGRNAVMEALKSDKDIDTVFIQTDIGGVIGKIHALAAQSNAVIKKVSKQKLDTLCDGRNHQGVIAFACATQYASLDEILNVSKVKGTMPFIIIADEIEDPHNLGAIIRTAEACGADGIVIPKRRSAAVNSTVYKTSAGAVTNVKVARVANIVSAIKELKKNGVWIYGAEMGGTEWDKCDYTDGAALVIGSEGFGISRLIKEQCDFLISMPMLGQINSLNASVAAGILMYEIVRQRKQ